MLDPASIVVGGIAAAIVAALRNEQERRAASRATCGHDEGAAFVYHSLYQAGQYWNRRCWRCGKHETHWPGNWPPPGARLKRGEREPGPRPQ